VILVIVASACAASVDTTDGAGDDGSDASVTTSFAPADEAQQPPQGESAPSDTLPVVPPEDESDLEVTEPPTTEQPPTTEPGDPGVDDSEAQPPPEPDPADYDGPLAHLVAIAMVDLAERLNVGTSEIEVVSVESVVWPDGSLGCPLPGMRYTQVQIDGAKIVLAVDGGVYNYHSGANRDPFLCVPTKATTDSGSGGEQSLPTTTIGPDE
jgi:hypothetical protein